MCNAPAFLFREPIKQLRPSGALAPTKAPVHCSKDFACPENNTCCRTKFGGCVPAAADQAPRGGLGATPTLPSPLTPAF